MSDGAIAPVRAMPLAEIPAVALRIASGFATASGNLLDCVQLSPGLEEGQVTVFAASPTRVVQITADGTCTRRLALPVKALQAALRRDRDAEHATIVEGETGLLSVRLFSEACTVATAMPEGDGAPLTFPEVTPGPCEVTFNPGLLRTMLNHLQPLRGITIEPFATGLMLQGVCEGMSATALLAGIRRG